VRPSLRNYWIALGVVGAIAAAIIVVVITSGGAATPVLTPSSSTTTATQTFLTPRQVGQIAKNNRRSAQADQASERRIQMQLYQISIALSNSISPQQSVSASQVTSLLEQAIPKTAFVAASQAKGVEQYAVSTSGRTITIIARSLDGSEQSLVFNAQQGMTAFHSTPIAK
jgi:hypothetical protein